MLQQHLFSATFEAEQHTLLFFQIVVLERQLYAWIGTAPPRLGGLCLAMPTRLDPVPSATTLLPGPTANEDVTSMTQRLAKRTGRPVALSVNLPANEPLMRAFAERRLLEELQQLQLVQQAANLSLQGAS